MIQSRFRRITWFFGRVILSIIWWDMLLPWLGFRALSRRTRAERMHQVAVRFRALAVQMGGVMIKVGQFLSARLDVLPPEITDELTGLQDEVRPEAFESIRLVVEKEINGPVDEKFIAFEREALASASIGQVHRARIAESGQTVVVKVQRTNIERIVETDLAALKVVSGWINRYPPIRKRANVPALVAEFSRSLYEEIDYLNEGKNAETFAANFAHRPQVCVPQVYWTHTTRRMLTLEEIQAIKITDYEQIEAAGISRAEVADRLFDTYLQQIFEDRFFHADPHPGNLFVFPIGEKNENAREWKLVFVDFGMTGTVAPNQLTALREIMIAVGTQDIPRLVRSYQTMGVLLPGADTTLLEKATVRVFERFWGKSTTEMVSLGHQEAVEFAKEFGDLLYQLPFQVPENLILLGRCLGILSGICTGLNPDFNVWVSAMPYARKLIEADTESGEKRNVVVQEALNILRVLVSLPTRADTLLQRIEQGRLEVQTPELKEQLTRLEKRFNRLTAAILFAALFAGSVQLALAGILFWAAAGFIAAFLAIIWVIAG
jgi:predicted unusual protein kinase regulating ubiquinone biosynthesis (AarF/ABC1/UbiB family)